MLCNDAAAQVYKTLTNLIALFISLQSKVVLSNVGDVLLTFKLCTQQVITMQVWTFLNLYERFLKR